MVDPLMLLARLAIALSPAPLYGPQIWKVRRSAQDGFSTFTCLTLLVSSILRCFFWLGRRFDDALLVQALLTIFVQLLLLDAIVALRSKKHGQRHFFGGGGGGGGGHHGARRTARPLFVRPRDTWPPLRGTGLGMELLRTDGGVSEFTFTHSAAYAQSEVARSPRDLAVISP